MGNENLKNALTDAGMTAEDLAQIIRVDPKTVGRWLAGASTPYPRHRANIARALNLTETDLWPEPVTATIENHSGSSGTSQVGDVVGSWGHATDPDAPNYIPLLAGATTEIDILDTGALLLPAIIPTLDERARAGCEIRILTRATHDTLNKIGGLESFAVRTAATLNLPTLFRADHTMLLTIPIASDQPPVLFQLEHRTKNGAFNRIQQQFQTLWDNGEHHTEPANTNQTGGGPQGSSPATPPPTAQDTRTEPTPPASNQQNTRRWPGRKD